jgi:hypothetical protein
VYLSPLTRLKPFVILSEERSDESKDLYPPDEFGSAAPRLRAY